MINIDYHAESVWNTLALHRFYIHIEEVKRALTPVLDEVYRTAYERGIADQINAITSNKMEVPTILSEEIINDENVTLKEFIEG